MKRSVLSSKMFRIGLIVTLLVLSGVVPPESNQAEAGPFCDLVLQTCFAGCDSMCSIFSGSAYFDCFDPCAEACCSLCSTAPGTGC